MTSRHILILDALKSGRLDTLEIAAATGIPRPGRALHDLLIERRVRHVGYRPASYRPPGGRPAAVWERLEAV